jgi:trehalose synthase
MHEVPVAPRPDVELARFVGPDTARWYEAVVSRAAARVGGRTLWHINSTAEGGGVAELLRSCLGHLRAEGIDVRWLVVEGDAGFFEITKRIHNRLHGELGDAGPLGSAEHDHYEEVTQHNLAIALSEIAPNDVVVVHDPQPLGLVSGLAARGCTVIWTCHVGVDLPNDVTRSAWDFLRPYVDAAAAYTFTRHPYVWEGLDEHRLALIPPCIDPSSLKNAGIERDRRDAILAAAGLVAPSLFGHPTFTRGDGTESRVTRAAEMLEEAPVPAGAPLVVQVSRWDRLKDPRGVLQGFLEDPDLVDAHLILAGPAPSSVADDPEAEVVLAELVADWTVQPWLRRERIHLANIPTSDVEENAVIVNALQRRADVVVQKSLAEGFGLTVTEAMWKGRPIVAGRVGGIQEQIDDGVHGLLVDPRDLTTFGNLVQALIEDPSIAQAFGGAAQDRVRERYLPPHYLGAYLELIERIDA